MKVVAALDAGGEVLEAGVGAGQGDIVTLGLDGRLLLPRYGAKQ